MGHLTRDHVKESSLLFKWCCATLAIDEYDEEEMTFFVTKENDTHLTAFTFKKCALTNGT